MDAWSERFKTMEERSLEFKQEVYQRLSDVKRDVEVLKIDFEAEIDKSVKSSQKETARKITVSVTQTLEQDFETKLSVLKASIEQQFTNLVQASEVATITKLERVLFKPTEAGADISGPLRNFGLKIQTISEESKSMHLRLLNVERRLIGEDGEVRMRTALAREEEKLNPKERDDYAHEAHLKLITILTEINDVKASFKLLENSASEELLRPEGIPNFSNYVPYMDRISELEGRVSLFAEKDRVSLLSQEIENIKQLLLDQDLENSSPRAQPAGLVDILQEIGSIKKQVTDGRFQKQKPILQIEPIPIVQATVVASSVAETDPVRDIPLMYPVDPNTELLKEAMLTLQKSVSQKVSRGEIQSILASTRRNSAMLGDQSKVTELLHGLDDRMTAFNHDIEKIRKELAESLRTVNNVDEHMSRQDNLQQEALQRMRFELSQQLHDFQEKVDTSSENPESAKSLVALKIVITKMQRDIKELRTSGDSATKSASNAPPSPGAVDNIRDLVLKHEALLTQLSTQVTDAFSEFEETQIQLKRQSESALAGSLKQMEELQKYVSSMMERVNEGAKLSQIDLEKLNEVMAMLEEKGDRSEIKGKVDKSELRNTQRILSKRIELLQKELKRSETVPQLPMQKEDPLLIKTRLDHECLSCGQEVPFPNWQREWKPSKRFPESKFRLGPGFSKILPLLKDLSDVYTSHHQKTLSDDRTTPGSRIYSPVPSGTPLAANSERGSLYRIMTGKPGSRSNLHRRKNTPTL